MDSTIDILDRHYADQLGCGPGDFSSGRVVVVANDRVAEILFAKGIPLALFGICKPSGTVIAARELLALVVERVVREVNASDLSEPLCAAIREAVDPLVSAKEWFRGLRLYCSPETFADRQFGEARDVTDCDEEAAQIHRKWGGRVFGQVVDSEVVAWCGIKPLSEVAWDLTVKTHPDHRGKGYAKSAVSAAVKHIFANGKLATWGTDLWNEASMRTARSVGFSDYGLDFGCVEEQ